MCVGHTPHPHLQPTSPDTFHLWLARPRASTTKPITGVRHQKEAGRRWERGVWLTHSLSLCFSVTDGFLFKNLLLQDTLVMQWLGFTWRCHTAYTGWLSGDTSFVQSDISSGTKTILDKVREDCKFCHFLFYAPLGRFSFTCVSVAITENERKSLQMREISIVTKVTRNNVPNERFLLYSCSYTYLSPLSRSVLLFWSGGSSSTSLHLMQGFFLLYSCFPKKFTKVQSRPFFLAGLQEFLWRHHGHFCAFQWWLLRSRRKNTL